MCHADREGVYAWIAEHGGIPDSPETLREKVLAAIRPRTTRAVFTYAPRS